MAGNEPLDAGGDNVEELIAHYVDRLTEGDLLDPDAIREAHPEIADALLADLEAFVGVGPKSDAGGLLGTLGDYTLRRQIGRGGMGVVYEAWENSMDRAVALKVLPAGVAADNKAFLRFMREAKTAGQLKHPNIVYVHGLGLKEQTPYYAMELVKGETLAEMLAGSNLVDHDTETPFGHRHDTRFYINLAEAFADVADGLQHAHSKGVLHRDVKPSNLILDADVRLRILDFGLARLEGQDSLTLSGDVVGTPSYMSPEQARAQKTAIDHRTDIYSLGATLYEVLTARPPFKGKDHQQTLSQIIERDPVSPTKLDPRVPPALETIVLKCLRKEPGDRYGTAEALAQDLRRFVRGDPIEARPRSPLEKAARRLWMQRRVLVTVGVVLVVALAALLVSNVLIARARDEAEAARDEAAAARDSASYDLYVSNMRLAMAEWEAGNVSRLEELLDAHRPQPGEPDLRRWEWYYLEALSQSALSLEGHADQVHSVAWSPGGELLASGSGDRTVKIWNAITGDEVRSLPCTAPVTAVDWSVDGRLAAIGVDGVVRVWRDLSDAEILESAEPRAEEDILLSVAWSPDGRQLAAGSLDGTVTLWNTASGEMDLILSGASGAMRSVSWRPDGKRFAGIAMWSKLVFIWDTTTGSEVRRFPVHRNSVTSAAWSPDGERLAVTDDQRIKLWDVESGEELFSLPGHAGIVPALAFAPDGDGLASVATDGTVKVWDLGSRMAVRTLRGHRTLVLTVAWSSDGGSLASGSHDGTVKVWDVSREPGPVTLPDCRGYVAWSPDGRLLASRGTAEARQDGVVKIFDAVTGEEVQSLARDTDPGHSHVHSHVRSIAWSSSGALIATGASNGTVSVWALEEGLRVFSTRTHSDDAQPASGQRHSVVAWNHDVEEERLATGGVDGSVRIWDVRTGRELASFEGHSPVMCVAWSPNGEFLASASRDQGVKVWRGLVQPSEPRMLRKPASNAWYAQESSISWSPDGERLAAGSREGLVTVWEISTGKELVLTQGHTALSNTVAWSPDGLRLISGGEDRTLKIYDASSGKELMVLRGHTSSIHDVAWSPAGRRLASASREVKIWDAPGNGAEGADE